MSSIKKLKNSGNSKVTQYIFKKTMQATRMGTAGMDFINYARDFITELTLPRSIPGIIIIPYLTPMNKNGPIIVIEDDADDREMLRVAFNDLNYANEVCYFETGKKALAHLQNESIYPFLIISDVNLPELNGFELRKMVHTNEGLSAKCIPYVFFSTAVDKQAVIRRLYHVCARAFSKNRIHTGS
jgi:CheY-like chemotaxis protein